MHISETKMVLEKLGKNEIPDKEWEQINLNTYRCSNDTNIRSFQYKYLHMRIK